MTCFVAHLRKKGYFEKVGIEVTSKNARAIEDEIARVVGKSGSGCPDIWKEMKTWLEDPKKKAALEKRLKARFGQG